MFHLIHIYFFLMKTMKLQILKESYECMKNTTSAKFQPSVFIFPCSLF